MRRMRAQANLDASVDILPFGMMIDLVGIDSAFGYETDGRCKTRKPIGPQEPGSRSINGPAWKSLNNPGDLATAQPLSCHGFPRRI